MKEIFASSALSKKINQSARDRAASKMLTLHLWLAYLSMGCVSLDHVCMQTVTKDHEFPLRFPCLCFYVHSEMTTLKTNGSTLLIALTKLSYMLSDCKSVKFYFIHVKVQFHSCSGLVEHMLLHVIKAHSMSSCYRERLKWLLVEGC